MKATFHLKQKEWDASGQSQLTQGYGLGSMYDFLLHSIYFMIKFFISFKFILIFYSFNLFIRTNYLGQ